MKTVSWKISDSLHLVQEFVGSGAVPKAVEVPVHHIAVIDCSGSMSGDLPRIREQFKMKLPEILNEKDTLSIIWFSGRGQFGIAAEAISVTSVKDLKSVYSKIDDELQPRGLTGFKEPIQEVSRLVGRVSKKYPDGVFSLFFMSDGCDNQWDRADILSAVESASGSLASATFVEYGYYADRPLLSSMAQKSGGSLIFSEDFSKYAPTFEAALKKKLSGAPRVEVKIHGDPIEGFAFALRDGELLSFDARGVAHVPQDLESVFYLSPSSVGTASGELLSVSRLQSEGKLANHAGLDAAYAAVSLFSIRAKSDVVYPLLRALGDVAFIESFASCFGKQKYTEYMESSKAASFGTGRFSKGWDPKKVPRDDAFTVLDVLQVLTRNDDNRVLLDSPHFKYSRIGRGRVDANSVLTDEQQAEVANLTTKIAAEKDVKKLRALQSQLSTLIDSKKDTLEFMEDKDGNGYSISSLTFNEERPNVSILVRKTGTVDVSKVLPEELKGNKLGSIPEKFPTFVYRNYAVIKDGLVNIKTLPVKLSDDALKTFTGLIRTGMLNDDVISFSVENEREALIFLDKLPVINRKMVNSVSAKSLFELGFELTKARASQKVYNSFKKEKIPTKKSESYGALYGEAAATWLKDQGFTDYSGFAPKTVQAESTDFYMAKELRVLLAGYSSIPSLNDYRKQIQKNKFNGPGKLMTSAYQDAEAFLASDAYLKASSPDDAFSSWIDAKCDQITKHTRSLIFQMAQIKFSVVVGQVWPSEFKSVNDNQMKVDVDGTELSCTLEMREVQQSI